MGDKPRRGLPTFNVMLLPKIYGRVVAMVAMRIDKGVHRIVGKVSQGGKHLLRMPWSTHIQHDHPCVSTGSQRISLTGKHDKSTSDRLSREASHKYVIRLSHLRSPHEITSTALKCELD